MAGGLFDKGSIGKNVKAPKYEDGARSLTGKVVKKGKPVPKAYMDSKDVTTKGGNPLSNSGKGEKIDRNWKPADKRDDVGHINGWRKGQNTVITKDFKAPAKQTITKK